jgi:hypothetical protein
MAFWIDDPNLTGAGVEQAFVAPGHVAAVGAVAAVSGEHQPEQESDDAYDDELRAFTDAPEQLLNDVEVHGRKLSRPGCENKTRAYEAPGSKASTRTRAVPA